MNPREEEEAALPEGEKNDLNEAVERFNQGEYGFYGDRDNPGLLARLTATQAYWEKIRSLGAQVKESTGWITTLEMPQRQLVALHQFLGYKLTDEEAKMSE